VKKIFLVPAIVSLAAFSVWAMQVRSSVLAANRPVVAADALVLLAGGKVERVHEAVRLYKSGTAHKILITNDGVLTRWSKKDQRNPYNVELSREELVKLGIPAADLVLLPYVKSGTIYDALVTKKYMATACIKKIAIVTSDYHSGRALWAFRRVMGGDPSDINVVPVRSVAAGLRHKLFEVIKFDYYLIRYGLVEPELSSP